MNKIIVLDLDGTILKKDKTMSENTINTLLQAKKEGNMILFATARPQRDTFKYIPEFLRGNPVICNNGAIIVSSKNFEVIYRKTIKRGDVLKIIDIIESYNYKNITIEVNDNMYSNFDTTPFFGNSKNEIRDLRKMVYENADKVIICEEKTIDEKILKQFPSTVKGMLTDSKTLCQIINSSASKWNALINIARKLGVDNRNIIAFGDDVNDFDMIENAGIGVAMGNAENEIKNVADYITDTNENDGVAKFLKENILNRTKCI